MESGQGEAWGKSEVFSLEAGLGRNGDSWLHVKAWGKVWEKLVFKGRFKAGEGLGQVWHAGTGKRKGFGIIGVQGNFRCGHRRGKQRFDSRFRQKVEGWEQI